MAERLYPGVYMEERPSGLVPIQGVSTSNMGIVGFTKRGPVDRAVLVTSYAQFERIFGGFTEKSLVPTEAFSFFANQGRRAYVVRTVPADAAAAEGMIGNRINNLSLATGDGSEVDFTDGVHGVGPLLLTPTPVRPGTVQIRYNEAGSPVVAQAQALSASPTGTLRHFAFVIPGAPLIPGSVTIGTTVSAGAVTYTDDGDGVLEDAGSEARGFIDYESGAVSLSVATSQAPDAATSITASYTPVGAERTIVDDGAGTLSGATLTGPGSVDYVTGEVEFEVTVAPASGIQIRASFVHEQWTIEPISAGEWGNDLTVVMRGNVPSFDRTTGSFSRYDLLVFMLDVDGVTRLAESFSDLSFTDPTSPRYAAGIINAVTGGSSLIRLSEPANSDTALGSLNGTQATRAAGAGNGSQLDFGSTSGAGGTPTIPAAFRVPALSGPVQRGSVTIFYTNASGEAQEIRDDGAGTLVGDEVDAAAPAGFNIIDYTTGHFSVRLTAAVTEAETSGLATPSGLRSGAMVTAVYYKTPLDVETQDTMEGGDDGTSLTRAELTSPALAGTRRGAYALLRPDELMNVTVPDAAGNVTMTLDLLAEAERNNKWFVICATPSGLDPQGAQDYRRFALGISTNFGALYWPWIRVTDPVTDLPVHIPPGGHVAGVYARTDNSKGVGKAPAGVEDGRLAFATGLEYDAEFEELSVLHQFQVNALINRPQTGRCVWGARTLENPQADFRFVHARRLFNFLRASIFNSTHGFVFENTGPALWSRIRLSAESFLLTQFNQGQFAGGTPSEAYLVVVDESNNPIEVQNSGEVVTDIYVAVNNPGEFITFRLQQKVRLSAG